MPFGKFKGDALEDIPTQYLVWLLESEALYDDALRRAVVLEVIQRIAPEYKPPQHDRKVPPGYFRGPDGGIYPNERFIKDQEPTSRKTYDPGGVFNEPTGQRVGTGEPNPTPIKGQSAGLTNMMRELVEAGYRALARRFHPDAGGTHEQMVTLNAAADALRRSLPRPSSGRSN